ncbi:hypothetical protein [Leclercia sp. Marseille-Q4284]|uniref:hypothetical protein n=1 Tax=Leclercia sp. Marseille-Q4284 TaxID=2866582 RepID=UPI001CE4950E|nr:hypothetical protein [Leclercia sp. Marseille-Q4284]
MAKKSALDNINTDAAVKSTGRKAADELVSKMFRMTPQQDQRLREAMYLSGKSLKDIMTEGLELWIAENLKGKM